MRGMGGLWFLLLSLFSLNANGLPEKDLQGKAQTHTVDHLEPQTREVRPNRNSSPPYPYHLPNQLQRRYHL